MNTYRAGIDIGSTTVKLVILSEEGEILFGQYRRHHAHTQQTLKSLLMEAKQTLGPCDLRVRITGSGAINLGKALEIGFVQEVVAVATALKTAAPQTDVAIELGGEDAKIIYFKGGLEERMNGVCAGGTGSFIDQMAALLQTDATGLNEAAKDYQKALRQLRRNPKYKPAQYTKNDIERFFHSEWFHFLTDADPDYLLDHIARLNV